MNALLKRLTATCRLNRKFRAWKREHVPSGVCISRSYFVEVLDEGRKPFGKSK